MSAHLAALAGGTEPARPLGVFRALVGLAALVKGIDVATSLEGRRLAWAGVEVAPQVGPLVATVWLVAAAGLLVGYRCRLCALAIAGLTAVVFAFAGLYSNHGYFLGTLALLLAFSDSGAAFSLDARLGRGGERVTRLGVTLIRVQISVVYAFSALSKLNQDFLLGNTLYYHAREAVALPDAGTVAYVPLFVGLAVGAILLELFVAAGLWIARARPAAFVVGLALHAGMVLILSQRPLGFVRLTIFAVLALSCYLLFLDVPARRRVLVWDESCSVCSAFVRWLGRLDWLGAVRTVRLSESEECRRAGIDPAAAGEGLYLVALDGTVHSGFAAVRRVLEVLPISFLWAPLLGLAPIRAVGGRAFRAAAAHRARSVSYGV